MKICTKCEIDYPATLEYFYKHSSNKDNLYTWCKICERLKNNKWAKNNKEKANIKSKKYYQKHKEQVKEKANAKYKEYKEQNKQQNRQRNNELSLKWYKNNPKKANAKNSFRRTKIQKAMFQNKELIKQIKEIYLNCPKGYEVDHIIPLVNNLICGLHVPYNLQYLTVKENRRKGNHYGIIL